MRAAGEFVKRVAPTAAQGPRATGWCDDIRPGIMLPGSWFRARFSVSWRIGIGELVL
jgi:hypothetical protein